MKHLHINPLTGIDCGCGTFEPNGDMHIDAGRRYRLEELFINPTDTDSVHRQ